MKKIIRWISDASGVSRDVKKQPMKTIEPNTMITARFATDADLRPKIKVVERVDREKSSFAVMLIDGELVKRKIHSDRDKEYVFPYGKYSMAPIAH